MANGGHKDNPYLSNGRAVRASPEASNLASLALALAAILDDYFATVSAIHLLSTNREGDDARRFVQLRLNLSQQLNDISRLLSVAVCIHQAGRCYELCRRVTKISEPHSAMVVPRSE